MTHHVLDEVWDSAIGGLDWLKSVLIGEFADNRPLSAVIADLLTSFVPGVVIVTSARDAVAVIIRLARRPERRQEPMEWMLLSACLITLALPLALGAGGLAVAGGGAAVGGLAGSELGAVLRAVILMLIKEARSLSEILLFLQKFMHGDIILFLRSIKFEKYKKILLNVFDKVINKLLEICRALKEKLKYFEYFDDVKNAITKLSDWERQFYALQQQALRQLPLAVEELDKRLVHLLTDTAPKESRVVVSGLNAPAPNAKSPAVQRVQDPAGAHLMATHSGGNVQTGQVKGAQAEVQSRTIDELKASEIKEKPDKVESVTEEHNSKRQEAMQPDPGGEAASVTAVTTKDYGVAFFGSDNKAYYTPATPTIGRAGRPFFLMPLEDSGIVANAGDAARYTGMAPSAQKAYVSQGSIYGLSFPMDGM